MAVALAVDDVIEARFQSLSVNQVSVNVLHYRVASLVGTPLTDQQVADGLSAQAAPLYKAWFSVDTEYLGLRLQRIAPAPKATYVISVEGAGVGALDEDDIPQQNAVGVVKLTAEAARRFRGFVFLPFWTELHLAEDGTLTAAGGALAEAWATVMLEPITVVDGADSMVLTPVIHSLGNGTTDLVVDAPIIGRRIQQWFVTMRSRGLNRRGDLLGP